MERFVALIVAGGVALVAGLWLTAAFAASAPGWLAGVALALTGVGCLAVGIERELDY